jgi:hypothetical protein
MLVASGPLAGLHVPDDEEAFQDVGQPARLGLDVGQVGVRQGVARVAPVSEKAACSRTAMRAALLRSSGRAAVMSGLTSGSRPKPV